MGKRSKAIVSKAKKTAGVPKKQITARQRAARKINIEVARRSKKKGQKNQGSSSAKQESKAKATGSGPKQLYSFTPGGHKISRVESAAPRVKRPPAPKPIKLSASEQAYMDSILGPSTLTLRKRRKRR